MPGYDRTVIRGEPDRLGLGNQVADGDNQPVIADDDAAARALGAEYRRGERVLRNFGAQRHDRVEHGPQIEAQAVRGRLQLSGKGPVRGFSHG